mmetsp:Transcript_1277/g.1616  ORF Transcript_1277/g.1616 Transcript_1277/m.1616 type:complete len:156 (-) Transcript_1277:231-698(-)
MNLFKAKFVNITTEKGKSIAATRYHLLPISKGCKEFGSVDHPTYIYFTDVLPGMCIYTIDGIERVVRVTIEEKFGTYTFVAAHGDGQVVVNGIVASSFGMSYSLVNNYYNIHRFLYIMTSVFATSSTFVNANLKFGDVVLTGMQFLKSIWWFFYH